MNNQPPPAEPQFNPPQPPAIAVATDIGRRDHQEDAMWHGQNASTLFAIVADGAGGHGGGAEASAAAIATARAAWEPFGQNASAPPDPRTFLDTWILDAHRAVNTAANALPGTTRAAVAACLVAN